MSEENRGLPDIEKVIKGFEMCMNPFNGCRDCPYKEDDLCEQKLREDVLAMAKAYEPIQAVSESANDGIGRWYHCGSCGASIYYGANYCGQCGRKVLWND